MKMKGLIPEQTSKELKCSPSQDKDFHASSHLVLQH